MNEQVIFFPPEPPYKKTRIWPVFLPFAGCPQRCIYCAQNLQTSSKPAPLSIHYQRLKESLDKAIKDKQPPLELAFFGGTFTALPNEWLNAFLKLGNYYRQKGLITSIRCSTRPDFIDPPLLEQLRKSGLDMIELGIQSFSNNVLKASKRGYTQFQAHQACRTVLESELDLGIQLLPGLPQHSPKKWIDDIQTTCSLHPQIVRIYPCLLLKGTPLAKTWFEGSYHPWSLHLTIKGLSRGILKLWRQKIPVIRIGLHPEQEMLTNLLAGPWHPSLGLMVRSRILFYILLTHSLIMGNAKKRLMLPEKYQGEIWGYKKNYLQRYKNIGIDPQNVQFWDRSYFMLQKLS
ncbi:MAG TPA: radical SAM protein [Desulfohalobiaceae bacterium]|nr:radical SAM protein [Desulfohalobiaceae bacterium]